MGRGHLGVAPCVPATHTPAPAEPATSLPSISPDSEPILDRQQWGCVTSASLRGPLRPRACLHVPSHPPPWLWGQRRHRLPERLWGRQSCGPDTHEWPVWSSGAQPGPQRLRAQRRARPQDLEHRGPPHEGQGAQCGHLLGHMTGHLSAHPHALPHLGALATPMLSRPPASRSTFLLGTWPGPGAWPSALSAAPSVRPHGPLRGGGGPGPAFPGTEAETPAPGQRQWRKPGGGVLQLCIHYKLKTLSPRPCSSALPGLGVKDRFPSRPSSGHVQSRPSFPLLCGPLVTRPVTVSGEQAALQSWLPALPSPFLLPKPVESDLLGPTHRLAFTHLAVPCAGPTWRGGRNRRGARVEESCCHPATLASRTVPEGARSSPLAPGDSGSR